MKEISSSYFHLNELASLDWEVVENFHFLSASWMSQATEVDGTKNITCFLFNLKVVRVTVSDNLI